MLSSSIVTNPVWAWLWKHNKYKSGMLLGSGPSNHWKLVSLTYSRLPPCKFSPSLPFIMTRSLLIQSGSNLHGAVPGQGRAMLGGVPHIGWSRAMQSGAKQGFMASFVLHWTGWLRWILAFHGWGNIGWVGQRDLGWSKIGRCGEVGREGPSRVMQGGME